MKYIRIQIPLFERKLTFFTFCWSAFTKRFDIVVGGHSLVEFGEVRTGGSRDTWRAFSRQRGTVLVAEVHSQL